MKAQCLSLLTLHAHEYINAAGIALKNGITILTPDESMTLMNVLDEHHKMFWYTPREVVDKARDVLPFLQILPYLIVRVNGEQVVYQRPMNTTEGRLAGNYSVGLGGHIDIDDWNVHDPYHVISKTILHSLQRELREELAINSEHRSLISKGPVALIADVTNDVNRHHLGLVYMVDVRTDDPATTVVDARAPNELMNLQMVDPMFRVTTPEGMSMYEMAESWTKLIWDAGLQLSRGLFTGDAWAGVNTLHVSLSEE